jgi:hypothetical protein
LDFLFQVSFISAAHPLTFALTCKILQFVTKFISFELKYVSFIYLIANASPTIKLVPV